MSPLSAFLELRHLFSGLNYKYLDLIHKEIFALVKYGNFSYNDIMLMPTYSRRIFLKELAPKKE